MNLKKSSFIFLLLLDAFYGISQKKGVVNQTEWYNLWRVYDFDTTYSYQLNLSSNESFLFHTYKYPSIVNTQTPLIVRDIPMDWTQYYFAKYKNRKLNRADLLRIAPMISFGMVDTTKLCDSEIKNFVTYLMFKDSRNTHIVFDLNYNCDFSDDKSYSFPTKYLTNVRLSDSKKYIIPIDGLFEFCINGSIIKKKISFFFFPFKPKNLSLSQADDFFCEVSEPVNLYKVYIENNLPVFVNLDNFDTTKIVNIKIGSKDGTLRDKNYQVGDIFELSGKVFAIDSVDTKSKRINILLLKDSLVYGREKNMYFEKHLYGVNQFGKKISTNEYGKNYLLIDFWATWCVPCVKSTPIIANYFKKYREKNFSILSISLDKMEDANKIKKAIKLHKMDWDVMMPNSTTKSGANGFAEGGIPLFVLLDPSGKIIEVAKGLYQMDKISEQLKLIFE